MKGKSKADQHRSTGQLAESAVPVVSFDYAFMGDKSTEAEDRVGAVEEDEREDTIDVSRICA